MMHSSLYLSLVCFGIYVFLLISALRLIKRISPAALVCGLALIVYIGSLVFLMTHEEYIHFFTFSSTYWFLSLSLLMIFGAVYKSISLRMMLHLLNTPDKTDSYQAILEHYIKSQSYLNRFEILLEKELIESHDAHSYRLTTKGRWLANKLWFIQKTLAIKESG